MPQVPHLADAIEMGQVEVADDATSSSELALGLFKNEIE